MDSKPQNVDLQTLDQEAELQSYTPLCNPIPIETVLVMTTKRQTENHKKSFQYKKSQRKNNKTTSTTPKSKTVTGEALNIRSLSSKWFNNDQHIYSALQRQDCTCWRLSLLEESLFMSFVSSLCVDLPVQPVFNVLQVPGTCTSADDCFKITSQNYPSVLRTPPPAITNKSSLCRIMRVFLKVSWLRLVLNV